MNIVVHVESAPPALTQIPQPVVGHGVNDSSSQLLFLPREILHLIKPQNAYVWISGAANWSIYSLKSSEMTVFMEISESASPPLLQRCLIEILLRGEPLNLPPVSVQPTA